MKHRLAALVAAGSCVLGAQAYAHHSFKATYIEDKAVTIEGELVQVLFRNPHSFVYVTVKEKDGSMVRYAVEWGGATQLGGQAVTRETLKLGDYVVIRGNPGSNPSDHRIRMISLRRPSDGFGWGMRPGEVFD
ncbi:MAG: hypothetical protein HYX77_07130 [Acidobacteria bacterium]|nr:hypothetical protein [Acidobacteriota bacterium]